MKRVPRHRLFGKLAAATARGLDKCRRSFDAIATNRGRLQGAISTYKHAFDTTAADRDRLQVELDTYKHAFETTAADRDAWMNKHLWFRWILANPPVSNFDFRNVLGYPKSIIECGQFIADVRKSSHAQANKKSSDENRTIGLDGMLIGAEKSGTSYLYTCIREHDGIFVGAKDRDFFKILNSPPSVFEELFLYGRKSSQPVMAFDAAFMLDEKSASLLVERTQGRLKVVVAVLRDPIERAVSEYRMRLRQGLEYLPFSEAIKASSMRRSMFPGNWSYWWAYLERGLYWKQLEPYTRLLGRGILMVRLFEEAVVEKPRDFVAEILGRFDLAPPVSDQYKNLVQEGGKELIATAPIPSVVQTSFGVTRERLNEWLDYFPQGNELDDLVEYFKPDIQGLEDHLKLDVKQYWATSGLQRRNLK